MPHGPEKAVLVAAPAQSHGPRGATAGSAPICSGCPDRNRDMSGSGPLGPILSGVWQSLQPITVTRYLPRSTPVLPLNAVMLATSTTAPPRARAVMNVFRMSSLLWFVDVSLSTPRD